MSEGRLGGDVPGPSGGTSIVVDIAQNSSQRVCGANLSCRFYEGDQEPWDMRHRSKRAINCWIGQRIRQRRIALGITQQALGRALGVTWQQVQKHESGACSLRAAHLYQLALFLRVPIDELFEEATADDAPIPLETGQSAPHVNGPPSEPECAEFLMVYRRIDRFALRSAFSHLARAVAARENEQTGP